MWAEPVARAAIPSPGLAQAGQDGAARGAFDALWRHKFAILLAGLLGAAAAFFGSELLTPRYTASAQLLVDPRDLRVLDKQVTPSSVASDSGISIVESQVQVLTSDNVLRRVVERLDLADDPEFNGRRRTPLAAALGWLTSKFKLDKPESHNDAVSVALATLAKQVWVKRPERTFIIDVTVYSSEKEKSVRIADAIIKAYLEDQQQYRSEANQNTAQAIDAGLDALRQKVTETEKRVVEYRTSRNLVSAGGRTVSEQQLNEINNQLVMARAETTRLKARFDETQSARSNPDSIPEAVASPSLRGLRSQLSNIAAQKARLGVQMLPQHPAMQAVEEQEREVKRQIQAELQRIVSSARHEYERAKASEDQLARQVDTLQTQLNSNSAAQIGLRELEREYESNRQLYEQALARAKETREQAKIDTTNVRVISVANAAIERAFPPRKSLLVPAGLGLGLGLGIFGALAAYQLRRRPSVVAALDAPAIHDAPSTSTPAAARTAPAADSAAFVFADLRGACRAGDGLSDAQRSTGSRIVDLALTVVRSPMAPFARRMKSLYGLLTQAQERRRRGGTGPMAVVLTSEGDNEVKSAVALGLAYAAVAKSQRVLLVDGDLRNRRLSAALPETHDTGIEDVIAGRSKLEDAVVVRPDSQLEFLPAVGQKTARQPLVLNAATMQRLLSQTTAYDLVIFESPALGTPGLGQTFAESFDDMLLVLGVAPKSETELVEAMHLLRRAAPKFRGVVVTD